MPPPAAVRGWDGRRGVHNVRVISSSRSPVSSNVRSWAVLVSVAGLALSGCGGSATPKATPTTPTVSQQTEVPVPSGVILTDYGVKLNFGEPATVAYAPNERRKSVLELTVLSATKGRIADLSTYALEDQTRQSTPYYIRVSVKNVGSGDVGRTPIPLFLVDDRNTLISASSFTNMFKKCPSAALPTTFGPQATLSTCLVYLAPDHGAMTGVSFRAVQEHAPIIWTGTVKIPVTTTKKAS